MEFNQYGYLIPYGPVSSDLITLERVFVEEFSESATRRQLFESYRQFNDQIRDLMPDGFTQWVDGSFVSRKRDPGDIDLLTFVDTVIYDRYEPTFRRLRADYKSRDAPLDLFSYGHIPQNTGIGYTLKVIACNGSLIGAGPTNHRVEIKDSLN